MMMLKLKLIKDLFITDVVAARQMNLEAQAKFNAFTSLPTILQKYIVDSGFGQGQIKHAVQIKWKDTMLRFSENSGWKAISCKQVNFAIAPARLVYMKLYLWKFIPIAAYDRFINGQGNMLVKFLQILKLTDAKGKEMDESELITILAETMIFPLYALQNYISWESVDELTVKGTINYKGINVSGYFFFNEDAEIMRFETSDRYYSLAGKGFQKMKWTASARHYVIKQGLKYPSYFSATWNKPGGDYEYFKGTIDRIILNS